MRREFGRFIRARREEKNLSQDGLGQRAGLDRQHIWRIENGLTGTRRDTVRRLAEALDVDQTILLHKAGFSSPVIDDEASGLFSGYYELSEERRRLARRQIKALLDILRDENNKD